MKGEHESQEDQATAKARAGILMSVDVVDSNTFWVLMCHPAFMRTSKLSGRIGETVYVTLEAPEDGLGFVEGIVSQVGRALNA